MSTLVGWDWLVIAAYFAGLVTVVWWSSRRQQTAADYFLAGRNVGWFAIGGSLFASNIGSEHIVGLAGQGASTGMAMAHWELHAWIMLMLAWTVRAVLLPLGRLHDAGVPGASFSAAHALDPVGGVAGGLCLHQGLGHRLRGRPRVPDPAARHVRHARRTRSGSGRISTVILTGIYTVFGGLRAVLYTDTAQAVICSWAPSSSPSSACKARRLGRTQSRLAAQADQFALWRPMSDPDFPWLGVLIASPIIGIWYWCTDQYIVQRTLAASDLRDARRGACRGAFLKVWPVLIFLVPGLIGYALHQKGVIIRFPPSW
jgi:solute:Na+ symporter, SSS family